MKFGPALNVAGNIRIQEVPLARRRVSADNVASYVSKDAGGYIMGMWHGMSEKQKSRYPDSSGTSLVNHDRFETGQKEVSLTSRYKTVDRFHFDAAAGERRLSHD